MLKLSDDELEQALKTANSYAARFSISSLGFEDYASSAIEKLLIQESKPQNITAWLKFVIRNMMIDRARKINARGDTLRGLEIDEIQQMVSGNSSSLSSKVVDTELLISTLATLPLKTQQLLILDAAGFTTAEIAKELSYASAKVVATRLKQVRTQLRKNIELLS